MRDNSIHFTFQFPTSHPLVEVAKWEKKIARLQQIAFDDTVVIACKELYVTEFRIWKEKIARQRENYRSRVKELASLREEYTWVEKNLWYT